MKKALICLVSLFVVRYFNLDATYFGFSRFPSPSIKYIRKGGLLVQKREGRRVDATNIFMNLWLILCHPFMYRFPKLLKSNVSSPVHIYMKHAVSFIYYLFEVYHTSEFDS